MGPLARNPGLPTCCEAWSQCLCPLLQDTYQQSTVEVPERPGIFKTTLLKRTWGQESSRINIKQTQHLENFICFHFFFFLLARSQSSGSVLYCNTKQLDSWHCWNVFKKKFFYEPWQLAWTNCTCWWRAMLRPRRKLSLIFQEGRIFPVNIFVLQQSQTEIYKYSITRDKWF